MGAAAASLAAAASVVCGPALVGLKGAFTAARRVIVAICAALAASAATAEAGELPIGTSAQVGPYHVAIIREEMRWVERAGRHCRFLKPAKQKTIDTPMGRLTILGDGCLGCSVSPVRICEDRPGRTLHGPTLGFAVRLADGGAVRIGAGRAESILDSFCGHFGKALELKQTSGWANGRSERIVFAGECVGP